MTATEYFNKLLGYEEHRRELLERVNELELLATSTGAIRTDKERVKSSPSNKQEDLIIQLADMAKTYSQALHKANVMWMEADERISKLDKYERRMVLRYRYMASKPKMIPFSVQVGSLITTVSPSFAVCVVVLGMDSV